MLRKKFSESCLLLKKLGLNPPTIIDAGAGNGTPELYQVFPESYYLLIEPLQEFEADLIRILKQYKGVYILAAAGCDNSQITMNVHSDHLYGSSVFKESMGAEADGFERVVPQIRVDDLVQNNNCIPPFLFKIDVQGAELDVLEGAKLTIAETEAVILEVSFFEFMQGAPVFYDVVHYMKMKGFAVWDILPGWNRPLDDALGQVDIVFVKENGIFRKDHSYSTVEQLKAQFGS